MTETKKNFEVIKRYYFGEDGVVETQAWLIKNSHSIVSDSFWSDIDLDKLNEDLVPVEFEEKWGFVNVKTGETQIEPAYDKVGSFKNGFAPVYIQFHWGMIDVNGNMIVKPKYLSDSHFEGDFAIMYERNSWSNNTDRKLSDLNGKIVNKKGYEIISGCFYITRIGINIFSLLRDENGKTVRTIKQLIALPDYIVVIDNGEYSTPIGTYSDAKYIGGGTWSVIDYSGKSIKIPDYKLQEVKESLLA